MNTVGDIVTKSAQWLAARGVDSPRLDAELLLAHVLNCERLRLYLDWDKPLTEMELAATRDLVARRGRERAPVARLLGRKEFHSRRFEVVDGVFVPRPETEGLVERALDLLAGEPALQASRPVVFEVGTGSGCIIATLAAERPGPRYIASDISAAAIASAGRNAKAHHVHERVELRHGPLFAGYDGPIHLLVSNPPYVKEGEAADLPPEVGKHDPPEALFSGADGLDLARAILEGGAARVVHGGVVLLELGEDHEEAVLRLFEEGPWTDGAMERDYAGRPRYAVARRR